MNRDYKIYAVDFDDTLYTAMPFNPNKPNVKLIKILQEERDLGNKVILWTCREGEALKFAIEWCAAYGLMFDAVNSNLPEVIEYYGANSRKVLADVYIDNLAIMPDVFCVKMKGV